MSTSIASCLASLLASSIRSFSPPDRSRILSQASSELTGVFRKTATPVEFDRAVRVEFERLGHKLFSYSETREWAEYAEESVPGICVRFDYATRDVELSWASRDEPDLG